jgi:hypothetical protein
MLDERPHLSEVLDSDECGGLFWLARGGGCHGLGWFCALPAGNKINLPESPQIIKNYFQLFSKS